MRKNTVKPVGRPREKESVHFLLLAPPLALQNLSCLAPRTLGKPPALISYSNWKLRLQSGPPGQSQEHSQRMDGADSLGAFYITACMPTTWCKAGYSVSLFRLEVRTGSNWHRLCWSGGFWDLHCDL